MPETGFDCSGLIWWVYSRHGVRLSRTTGEQIKAGQPVAAAQVRAGDIVFFREGSGLHAGIATGESTFVHSPKSGGEVREEPLWGEYWRPRFIVARRILIPE